jgi:hypothetical protein
MDQIVIHLSINHATLPRIQIFLSNLQTGLLDMHVPVTYRRSRDLQQPDRAKPRQDHKLRSGYGYWSSWRTRLSSMTSSKAPSISEHPLRLQPELGIELQTTVQAEVRESRESSDNALRGSEISRIDGVRVKKEVRMAYNTADDTLVGINQ